MKPGECSWIDVMSAKIPLATSHTKPAPTSRSSGPLAWVSTAVTSAVAAWIGALIISEKSWRAAGYFFAPYCCTVSSIARSMGSCTTPVFWSTQA